MLSWVGTLWLLNAATGGAVAIREDLPGELIADIFRDDGHPPVR
jgi:hypothetical protein